MYDVVGIMDEVPPVAVQFADSVCLCPGKGQAKLISHYSITK